jgi:hypothetical protein
MACDKVSHMGFFRRFFGSGEETASSNDLPDEMPPEFPYELLRVRGAEAVSQSLAWRDEWRGTFTPVIMGPAKEFDLLTEILEEVKETPTEILQRAQGMAVQEWFDRQVEDDSVLADLSDSSAWNEASSQPGDFATVRDVLTRRVHLSVWIAKIPTAQPCEVPGYLKLGGWNACPVAEEHVAVWHYWQKKYGAEILCVTSDVIEATVAHPPTEKEECYVLAREQFSYCEDIVTQGVGTIDALAAGLRASKSWYFWWD